MLSDFSTFSLTNFLFLKLVDQFLFMWISSPLALDFDTEPKETTYHLKRLDGAAHTCSPSC